MSGRYTALTCSAATDIVGVSNRVVQRLWTLSVETNLSYRLENFWGRLTSVLIECCRHDYHTLSRSNNIHRSVVRYQCKWPEIRPISLITPVNIRGDAWKTLAPTTNPNSLSGRCYGTRYKMSILFEKLEVASHIANMYRRDPCALVSRDVSAQAARQIWAVPF